MLSYKEYLQEQFDKSKTTPKKTIKVNRVLSDEEVEKINSSKGVSDLPREEPIDLKELGF
jgi:hypothetical protein